MRSQNLELRVENLEKRVSMIEELPQRMHRVESQIVQLRTETRHEFSAVRQEMRDEFAAVRQEIHQLGTHMRVLHEDVISRIAALGEGLSPKKRRRSRG